MVQLCQAKRLQSTHALLRTATNTRQAAWVRIAQATSDIGVVVTVSLAQRRRKRSQRDARDASSTEIPSAAQGSNASRAKRNKLGHRIITLQPSVAKWWTAVTVSSTARVIAGFAGAVVVHVLAAVGGPG